MRVGSLLLLILFTSGCSTSRGYGEHEREERRERAYEHATGAPGGPIDYGYREGQERRAELYRAVCEDNDRWRREGTPGSRRRLDASVEAYRRELRENPDLDRCGEWRR